VERLQTALGQANADLMGCRDGALVRDLRGEVDRLTHELAAIGDRAVIDFDDQTIGMVDAAVKVPATYGEAMRAELAQYDAMKDKIDQLTAWLKEERDRADELARIIKERDELLGKAGERIRALEVAAVDNYELGKEIGRKD
jgi:uncharacterized coiled-coil DUF342 family protein